jgi:hypothetical protein
MKESPENTAANPPAPVAPEDLVKEFRAYLHLVITAGQLGRGKQLASLPGSQMLAYCRALAELPGNTLAQELAGPFRAILEQISGVAYPYEAVLRSQDEEMVALQEQARRVLGQLDLALGFMLRQLSPQARMRAEVTQDADLLCDWLHAITSSGPEAERLVRRYHQMFPEERNPDGPLDEGGFADHFAWDVYQRVAALDRLADEFPEHIRLAARQMHAWPMLMHRHTNNRRRFEALAKKLELGAEYPTDASEGARWRPDTPLVRYLEPLIHRLDLVYCELAGKEFESAEKEQAMAERFWWQWPEEKAGEEIIRIVCAARRLPALTKATASQWAEKALVPLILATDARDWQNCQEPVLQRIAKQKGVKSRATFKSRLLAAVTATLRRLARPA